MKRTANRTATGQIKYEWMPSSGAEWIVTIAYQIEADEPETNSAGGVVLTTKCVERPCRGLGGLARIEGAENTFDWVLEDDMGLRHEIEQLCFADADGRDSAALEAHYESKREARMGL